MISKLKYKIRLSKLKKEFRKKNQHNNATIENLCDISKIKVGKHTYGPINARTYGVENEGLDIGAFCSIADQVLFLLAGEHSYKFITSFPLKTKFDILKEECHSKGKIKIGDDVWIGHGVIILSGVEIGQGAIIAAGSVITKDVPSYAIVGGNPAKIIKYRFNSEIIDELLKIDFNNIDEKYIQKNLDLFYKEIKSKDDVVNFNNIKKSL